MQSSNFNSNVLPTEVMITIGWENVRCCWCPECCCCWCPACGLKIEGTGDYPLMIATLVEHLRTCRSVQRYVNKFCSARNGIVALTSIMTARCERKLVPTAPICHTVDDTRRLHNTVIPADWQSQAHNVV
jgi:hypothetical protein